MLTATHKFLLATLHEPPPLDRLRTLAAEGIDWETLYAACLQHGLFPLVNRTLPQLPLEDFPDNQRERLRAAASSCRLRSLQMARELERLLALFAAAEIPTVPFKGPVLAERAYGDVSLRVFDDLDLLVPQHEVRRAVKLLQEAGYEAGVDDRLLESPAYYNATQHVGVYHPDRHWLVEIHWGLFNTWRQIPFRFTDNCDISADGVAGRGGKLSDEEALLYLCIHGTLHWWNKLKWVVDIDRLVRSAPALDWPRLFERARVLGCRRALCLGLGLAHTCLGTPLPERYRAATDGDATLPKLERYVTGNWFAPTQHEASRWRRYWFTLAVRERFRDRLLMSLANPMMRLRRYHLGIKV